MTPTTEIKTCPECGQTVKLYRRNLYAKPAYQLILLYRLNRDNFNFHHIKTTGNPAAGGGDFAKLRFWGLIEEYVNDDPTKRTSGYWRITDKGRQFVQRKITVSKYVLIYNKEFYGFQGAQVFIDDCLGKRFNYTELMAA